MTTPDRGALRALRSAVLALFVVGLSAGGHAAAGGHLPDAAASTGLVALVAACCWLATAWRLPAGAAVALLAGSQVVLHAALQVLASAHPLPPVEGAAAVLGEHAGHAGHLARAGASAAAQPLAVASSTPATPGMSGMPWMPGTSSSVLWLGGPSASDASMLLAHAAVAAALALVYSRGEDALWALCAWLAPLAAVVVALVVLPVAPRPRPLPAGALVVVVRRVVLRAVRRRGPPVAAAG